MCVTGCGKEENTQKEKRITDTVADQETENTGAEDDSENKTKILIAYFTRADNIKIDPDVDATSSASINSKDSSYEGNLAIMADYIKDAMGWLFGK